jgi:hypothetical protein
VISADLRSFLLAQEALTALVDERIHVNHVPQESTLPYLWVGRTGTTHDRTLDQARGEQPFEEQWDCEAIAGTESEAQALGEAVRGLDCAKGAFGDGRIQLMTVEDQRDDYVPRGVPSDEGFSVCAFSLTIYAYTPGQPSSSSSPDLLV